jgi:GT2 family glycosyltransferase
MLKRNLPFFSIIIPTYARPEQLGRCLQAIARLDYPSDRFEVIVVDDGSPEPMEEVVAPFEEVLDLKLIRLPPMLGGGGPASARNRGAAHAKGEVLAFTDDDCEPESNWLQALAASFATQPDIMPFGYISRAVPKKRGREQMVGGQIINSLSDNLFSTATQLLISYLYRYYNELPDQAHPSCLGTCFFTTNNLALPAAQFKELGGFDSTFITGEDREFCDRWRHHGYRMTYTPQAIVYHAHPLTLASFWRQHLNYGRGTFNFRRVRAQRRQEPIKVERLAFYLNLLRYPFSQRRGNREGLPRRRALLLVGLLFISQVANVVGFFWEMALGTAQREKRLRLIKKGLKKDA